MQLSHTIAYAVQATLALARAAPGCPVPCSELAERGNMPQRFLLQILRSLVARGILNSAPGVSGGYYLARPPNAITLLDIVESFDGSLQPSVPELCGFSANLHEELMTTVARISTAARRELRKVSVADLAKFTDPPYDDFAESRIA